MPLSAWLARAVQGLLRCCQGSVPKGVHLCRGEWEVDLPHAELPMLRSFTFLRLTPEMLDPAYACAWRRFMRSMRANATSRRAAGPAALDRSPDRLGGAGKKSTATQSALGSKAMTCRGQEGLAAYDLRLPRTGSQ